MVAKSMPASNRPIGGMMMSSTSDETIVPNAAPMITPTARSTTLPFSANSRNSLSMDMAIQRSGVVAEKFLASIRASAPGLGVSGIRAQLENAGRLGCRFRLRWRRRRVQQSRCDSGSGASGGGAASAKDMGDLVGVRAVAPGRRQQTRTRQLDIAWQQAGIDERIAWAVRCARLRLILRLEFLRAGGAHVAASASAAASLSALTDCAE